MSQIIAGRCDGPGLVVLFDADHVTMLRNKTGERARCYCTHAGCRVDGNFNIHTQVTICNRPGADRTPGSIAPAYTFHKAAL